MNKIILTSIAATLFFTSCATKYQAKGWMGGYSEIVKARDTFEVIFEGNSYSSKNEVRKFAYRRAAELAVNRGYRYFMIVDQEDQTTTKKYLKTKERETSTADYFQEVLVKDSRPYVPDYKDHIYHPQKKEKNTTTFVDKSIYPAICLNIKCFEKRPEGFDVVDAEYFLLSNPL